MKLSEMQKDPMSVHVLSKTRANSLIDEGLAKPAVIDPMPESDVPVTLTALGRSATETETVADEPESATRKKQ